MRLMPKPILIVILAGLGVLSPSFSAAEPQSKQPDPNVQPESIRSYYHRNFSAEELTKFQLLLIVTGDYVGLIDGEVGPYTIKAITSFQRRNGFQTSGILSAGQFRRLDEEANEFLQGSDFGMVHVPEVDASVGLPQNILHERAESRWGLIYANREEGVILHLQRFDIELEQLFRTVVSAGPKGKTYSVMRDNWFVVSYTSDGRTSYYRFFAHDEGTTGLLFEYPEWRKGLYVKVALLIANTFFPGLKPDIGEADEAEPDNGSEGELFPWISFGSGIVVADNMVLTSAHVLEGCKWAKVGDTGYSNSWITDEASDLAIVKTTGPLGRPLMIADRSIRLGKSILALGYPLPEILASGLNVTSGIVSSLPGPQNDPNTFQFTALNRSGIVGGSHS
jgi:peptidoglycan hydrolase-like protein with peptidoglycan-binding domain